jgi:hypothetical protein
MMKNMTNEYTFLSGSLSKSIPASWSSDSIPKLKEEIKALQQKFEILQRRYVRLEYISVLSGALLRATEVVPFICTIKPHLGFGWSPSSLFGSTAGNIT